MSNNSRISKDAFEGIDKNINDIIEKTSNGPTPEKRSNGHKKNEEKKRKVYIRYNKETGSIVATAELIDGMYKKDKLRSANIPENEDAGEFVLTRSLFNKRLIDIHMNYKVDTSGKKSILVKRNSV